MLSRRVRYPRFLRLTTTPATISTTAATATPMTIAGMLSPVWGMDPCEPVPSPGFAGGSSGVVAPGSDSPGSVSPEPPPAAVHCAVSVRSEVTVSVSKSQRRVKPPSQPSTYQPPKIQPSSTGSAGSASLEPASTVRTVSSVPGMRSMKVTV